MKKFRLIVICAALVLSCLVIFTFAEDSKGIIKGLKSNARIIYNGKEADIGISPVLIEGQNYLSVRVIASLFDKNISWNQDKNEIVVLDKTNPQLESMASKLAMKDKTIEELEKKVKSLESDIDNRKNHSLEDLQNKINNKYGEFEDVSYRVILSGNEDEVRVKIEIDFSKERSAWNKLSISGRDELIEEVCGLISEEYDSAKIKGCIIDISKSKKQNLFHYNWMGELEKSYYKDYSSISILENRLNSSFSDYFKDMHLTIALNGNENIIKCSMYIQKDKFSKEWKNLSYSNVKNYMKKICNDIEKEFKGCYIYGYIIDSGSDSDLAFCEQNPEDDFIFDMD